MTEELGLPYETILSILKKDVPVYSNEGYSEFLQAYIIPNIARAISSNNRAILFTLKEHKTEY